MRLLLDTHIFLWWLKDDKNLSKQAREFIIDAEQIYISSASIWEAAIKIKLGKLIVNIRDLVTAIPESGFIELPVTVKHAAMVANLPEYHSDPFDRILISQATSEPLRFLTVDEKLAEYSELVELV